MPKAPPIIVSRLICYTCSVLVHIDGVGLISTCDLVVTVLVCQAGIEILQLFLGRNILNQFNRRDYQGHRVALAIVLVDSVIAGRAGTMREAPVHGLARHGQHVLVKSAVLVCIELGEVGSVSSTLIRVRTRDVPLHAVSPALANLDVRRGRVPAGYGA